MIAGYHWFTDWGRDTMISLEGLTLTTGRVNEARDILRTFAFYFRDGLIPNLFPEGNKEGLLQHRRRHAVVLPCARSLPRRSATTGRPCSCCCPSSTNRSRHHLAGTRFNIGMDPADGLLRQGAEKLALTWMDAKMGDWVVTPRRGKPVEINALWYNALCLLADWHERGTATPTRAASCDALAARARDSFNRRFWFEAGGYLYDVVDGEHGDDPACRPNQIFVVLACVIRCSIARAGRRCSRSSKRRLLTPVGLRSLDPEHPDYKPTYDGDLRTRDGAYHQGTVWAWLIGPFIDAWVRTHPDRPQDAREFLEAFVAHLDEACVGSISEIFDAEPPYTPRGCVAQAWSVAEVLRCWVKTGTEREAERGVEQLAAQGTSMPGQPATDQPTAVARS